MSKLARRGFAVGGAVAIVALIAWFVSGDARDGDVVRIAVGEDAETSPERRVDQLARTLGLKSDGGVLSEDELADGDTSTEQTGAARESVAPSDNASATDVVDADVPLFLTGALVVVEGSAALPSDLVVVLTLADGSTLNATRDGNMYGVPLPANADEIQPFASGLASRPLTLHRSELAARADERGRVRQDLVLWGENTTAIVVLAADGRSLADLARERDMEARQLFAYAFDFAVTAPLADEAGFGRIVDSKLGRLRRPGHREFEVAPDVVAFLDVASQAPVHVGLALHGVTVGWNVVARGERESVFVLPSNALAARLARLSLRAVVSAGGVPAPGVRVTLRAEKSPQRRSGQIDVPPDGDGRVVFDDVVPGEYELTVESDTALWSERVVLEPREQLDLGDVALGTGGVVELRTVDAFGFALDAYIEIGPFGTELPVDELFPSMLHRHSNKGHYSLPAPAQPTIVCARVIGTHNADTLVGSHVAILDPRLGLPTELVLELHTPITFAFTNTAAGAAAVHVRDHQGLLVERRRPNAPSTVSNGLPPGTYEAQLVDAAGVILARTSFTLAAGEKDRTILF